MAATVVAEFLRSPDVFQFDLMHAAVIRQLGQDSRHKPLFDLLQLVIDGNVKVDPYLRPLRLQSRGLSLWVLSVKQWLISPSPRRMAKSMAASIISCNCHASVNCTGP